MLEFPRLLIPVNEGCEIVRRSCICKAERTLRNAEILLDKPVNAAEVIP